MTGKPRKNRASYEGKRALNQHLHRHHNGIRLEGDLTARMIAHDELHWEDRHRGVIGHRHEPYQEGETDNQMAARMLAEGTAAQEQSE